jgi:dihydrofolate reductase
MGKLIIEEWLSLDGYAADKNDSTDFFSAQPEHAEGTDERILRMMDHIGTILLGANTYRMFVDYWPQATTDTEIIADKLNATPKVVFSSTLDRAPWGKWPEARVVSGDAVAEVKELKQRDEKDLVMWGSISLAQDLIRAGVVDMYHIRIVPVVLGAGRRFFGTSDEQLLTLVETEVYPSGLTLLRYAPK